MGWGVGGLFVFVCFFVVFFPSYSLIQRYGSPHCHIQCILLAQNLVDRISKPLENWSVEECENGGTAFPYGKFQKLFEGRNYFWIQAGSKIWYSTNPENVSIHFGREVYARAIEDPKVIDWKACITDEKRETATTEAFKNRFSPFDAVFK